MVSVCVCVCACARACVVGVVVAEAMKFLYSIALNMAKNYIILQFA